MHSPRLLTPLSTLVCRLIALVGLAAFVSADAHAQVSWRSDDIGSVGVSGRSSDTGGTVEIVGSGADIWDNADGFHFRHQPWTGNGEVIMRVTFLENTHSWAKVGLMVRESLQAGSRHALMCATAGNGTAFQFRTATDGASSSGPTSAMTLPVWLKIVRAGDTLTGFTSSNGTTWTQAGTVTLTGLPATVSVGIALTSHEWAVNGTARVDSIAFSGTSTPTEPGAPVITPKPAESVPAGYLYTYQIVASNSPMSYGASGLPAGLTLNPTTGEIRGVCGGGGGTFTVTLRATNASGTGTATQIMNLASSGPIEMPYIQNVTAPGDGTYRVGETLLFRVEFANGYGYPYVTGRPRFAFTLGGNTRYADYAWGSGNRYQLYAYTVTTADISSAGLVTGDTIDLNGGTIRDSWPLWCALAMRSISAPGIRCEAAATPAGAPTLSIPDTANGIFGQPFSFQITASNAPTSYSITLAPTPTRPLAISLNSATGVISGTLQASGTYTLNLAATNSAGTGTKSLTLRIPHIITSITPPTAGTYHLGAVLNFRLTFSNPMRVTGSPSIPVLIGDRVRSAAYAFGSERDHTFSYTVQAGDVDLDGRIEVGPSINLNGGAIQDAESGDHYGTVIPRNTIARDVIVDAPGGSPPVITSPEVASATVGMPFSYTITATNSPASYGASSLPPGLSANPSTGVISGTPTTTGTFVFQISAMNSGGTDDASVHLTISSGTGGWQSTDVGAVAVAGSSSEAGGTVTLRGSGADIWENADEFHYRYQTLTGSGEIVARITGLTATHPWAKAGLMFRESLTAGSRHVWLCVSSAFGVAMQYRGTTNGGTQTTPPSGSTSLPTWLRVVRDGDQVTCYISADGTNWSNVAGLGGTFYPATMYVGLALTSHDDGVVGTATFDNVRVSGPMLPPGPPSAPSLHAFAESAREVNLGWSNPGFTETSFELERSTNGTTFTQIASAGANMTSYMDTDVLPLTTYHYRVRALNSAGVSPYSEVKSATTPAATDPAPWSFADIGNVGVAGSNTSGANTITVHGAGADIWDTADSFRFVYRRLYRDGVVEAQVTSLTNTNSWAKAGVMIRQSLSPDSRNVFVFATPTNGIAAQARTATGLDTQFTPGPWTQAPYWVRLVRNGTRIIAYASPNGTTWTEIAAYEIAMTDSVYVGLAVTSHDPSQLSTAVFTDPFVQ